ncbi:MAG TPA: hypothetical protein VNB49_00230, partial [Candidatus Dormibacteraeota bacterium]|nr:hypothetical protein [Candidatus Dormibacteraeota bacterium]
MPAKSIARNKKTAHGASRVSSPKGGQAAAKWVGQPIRRKEENRLVSGKGIFVDDDRMPGMLHLRFVRSSYAHAQITRIDVS